MPSDAPSSLARNNGESGRRRPLNPDQALLGQALSKKAKNHGYAVALHFMHCNYCRTHKSLRMAPAMTAGVSDRLWDVRDIVPLVEATEPAPKKLGP